MNDRQSQALIAACSAAYHALAALLASGEGVPDSTLREVRDLCGAAVLDATGKRLFGYEGPNTEGGADGARKSD